MSATNAARRRRPTTSAADDTPPASVGTVLQGLVDKLEVRPSAAPLRVVEAAPDHAELADDLLWHVLEHAGVPSRYIAARFDTFVARPGTEAALAACQRVNNDRPNIILTGPPGSGKTHLAVAIFARSAAKYIGLILDELSGESGPVDHVYFNARYGFSGRFVNVPRLLDSLRLWVRNDEIPDSLDPLEPLVKARLLVLDDLGAERATDWVQDRLYALVAARYDEKRPTIATSNLALDQLAERGYDRITSRLLEDGPHVRLVASDYRLEAHP